MKKNLLTLAAALLVATSAWAQRFQFGSLYFNIIDDINKLVEVTYENNSGTNYPDLSGHLEIPDRVYRKGTYYMVTRIGEDAFSGCTGITIVNTSSNNIEIGDRAFWGCENINTMFIADNVGSIGREVFSYCTRLSQVSIGRALSTIGYGAFNNCESLKEINVDAANSTFCSENGILFNKDKTTLFKYPARKSETAYLIPESVKELETSSFEFCANLEKVIIPKGITYIRGGAFWDCAVLKEIIILATTPPTLGVEVFQKGKIYVPSEAVSTYNNHDSWKYITVYPLESTFTVDNLTYEITDYAENTVKLVSCKQEGVVNIPAVVNHNGTNYTVTAIASEAFYKNETVTEITISEGITSIGNSTFGRCFALTTVNIPASLTQMGDWVFDNCSALTAIHVAEGNTAYSSEDGVLFNKDKTTLIQYPIGKTGTTYTVPATVTKIATSAFENCTALAQINLPNSLTIIVYRAFYGCKALTEMTILATVPPTLGEDVFKNVNRDIPVYVPAASLAAYQAAEVWKDFNLQAIGSAFTVGGLTYKVTDQTAKTVDVTDFTDELPSTVTIPATVSYGGVTYTVTAIASDAFSQNETITEITISEGITSIGDYTFNKCVALTTVNIPARLTYMGEYVFDGCTSLTQINVDEANTAYCSENGVLFNKEKTTLLCYPAGKPETDYTIPSSVTVIGVNAFSNCVALTTLTIPAGVTTIESYAFYDCPGFTKMTVLATVPPTIADEDVFYNVNRDIPVYVPAASLEDYQAAAVWKDFNLQAMKTALNTPAMPESIRMQGGTLHNPQQLHLTLYDMQGRQVYSGTDATVSQPAGVYVLRCNGASGKVLF